MLEFSPVWDARWCYLAVLLCAVLSAYLQIHGRLNILKGKVIYSWSLFFTWLVFTIYLTIPLLLFWFLDRTNAINDTSLFAALLVGLAYPAVLSGGTSIKAAPGLGSVFDWLNKITDSLVDRTTDHVALRSQLFERALVDFLEGNEGALKEVKDLAYHYAESREQFMKDYDAAKTPREQGQHCYDVAVGSPEGMKPISRLLAKLKPKPPLESPYTVATRWVTGYTLVAVVLALVVGIFAFTEGHERFLIWRMVKPTVTAKDLRKTRAHLWERLRAGGAEADQLRGRLIEALQEPGLDGDRADKMLQLILASRGETNQGTFKQTAVLLTGALRFTPVDVRVRIHHALLRMAAETQPALGTNEALVKWTPIATDSLVDLEAKWRAWQDWWDRAELGAAR